MIPGKKISRTRFIPYLLQKGITDFNSVDFVSISQTLGGKVGIPFFIIISHNPIDVPQNLETIIEKRLIIVPRSSRTSDCAFLQFKTLISSIYALSYEKPIHTDIGIAGACSPDLLGYFVSRWLIEEKMMSLKEATNAWNQCGLPPVSKEKYVNELSRIFSMRSATAVAAQAAQKSSEKDYNNLLKILEKSTDEQNRNQASASKAVNAPQISTIHTKPLSAFESVAREINMKCRTFKKALPLFGYSNLTISQLKRIVSDKSEEYVIALNPSVGHRAFLYVHEGEKKVVCDDQLIITTDIFMPQSADSEREVSDTIIEGVFIDTREFRNTFIISDVVLYDGLDVSKEAIDVRLSYVLNVLFPARKSHSDKTSTDKIQLMVRPIFPFSDAKKILRKLNHVVPYPVGSLCIGPLASPWSENKERTRWFEWNTDPELPVVVLSVDYSNADVSGMVSTPFGMTKITNLGTIEQNHSLTDGSVVHISYDSNMKWRVDGSAEGEEIWSKKKFEEAYSLEEEPLTKSSFIERLDNGN